MVFVDQFPDRGEQLAGGVCPHLLQRQWAGPRLSMQYLLTIYTTCSLCTHYLYNIYTVSTHYSCRSSSLSSPRFCSWCWCWSTSGAAWVTCSTQGWIYFNFNKPSTKGSFGLQIMMNAGTTLDSSSNVCLPEVSWVGDCIWFDVSVSRDIVDPSNSKRCSGGGDLLVRLQLLWRAQEEIQWHKPDIEAVY